MVKSLEEAHETLVKNRNNLILGGTSFLKLGNKNVNIGIDLSNLELDYINDTGETIEIGPMTTLRAVETSEILIKNFDGVVAQSVEEIVGIQLRSVATVGGTVASKYGFSDLLTALLSLDTYVELYKGGIVALEDYMNEEKIPKDILVKVIIKKDSRRCVFQAMRNSKSDYALLNSGVSKLKNGDYKIVVGAKPSRAVVKMIDASATLSNLKDESNLDEEIERIVEEISFGTNMRASGEYREIIAKVLIRRNIQAVDDLK
jgi:CO/xanthine dehydrogenase FAD-binding subunit